MNSQKNEKVAFSSKETYDFQVLGYTLIIAGYKAIKIYIFHKLTVKLWLTEDDDLQNNSLIFIQIHSFDSDSFAVNQSNVNFFTFS